MLIPQDLEGHSLWLYRMFFQKPTKIYALYIHILYIESKKYRVISHSWYGKSVNIFKAFLRRVHTHLLLPMGPVALRKGRQSKHQMRPLIRNIIAPIRQGRDLPVPAGETYPKWWFRKGSGKPSKMPQKFRFRDDTVVCRLDDSSSLVD